MEVAAKFVALRYGCLVAVTGVEDMVTDGHRVRVVKGGSIQMTEVTGTGCLLGALTAATLTLSGDKMDKLAQVLKAYKEVARIAHEWTKYMGMFQIEVLNQLNFTRGVEGIFPVSEEFVAKQLESVFADFQIVLSQSIHIR